MEQKTAYPLIHIGYHKTASTWLQTHLFDNPILRFATPVSKKIVPDLIVHIHALDFRPEKCRDQFEKGMREISHQGMVPVVTAERLSGNAHSGGYDSKEIADRLVRVFPRGKVLCIIREQRSMILSTYKEYVRMGGTYSLEQYLQPTDRGRGRIPLFHLDYFKYHLLLEHYAKSFGEENLLVLPFELFIKEPQVFVQRILRFAGTDQEDIATARLPYSEKKRLSPSGTTISLKRRLNHLFADDRLNPGALFPNRKLDRKLLEVLNGLERFVPSAFSRRIDDRLQRTISDFVSDWYKSSNVCVAQVFGLDLASFGYNL